MIKYSTTLGFQISEGFVKRRQNNLFPLVELFFLTSLNNDMLFTICCQTKECTPKSKLLISWLTFETFFFFFFSIQFSKHFDFEQHELSKCISNDVQLFSLMVYHCAQCWHGFQFSCRLAVVKLCIDRPTLYICFVVIGRVVYNRLKNTEKKEL